MALCLHALTVEQYMIIMMAVIGYYFGYAVGRRALEAGTRR
jgi:hypothetical protein